MYKSKFNLLFEKVMKDLVMQAGIAIKDISPIKRENIIPTLQFLQQQVFDVVGISKDAYQIIGSVGKKPVSGDLDIAMDMEKAMRGMGIINIADYAKKLIQRCNQLGWQCFDIMWKKQGQKFFIGVPIVNQPNEIVQVDIMAINNMNYAKFMYFAPAPENSKYKGSIRSILVDALIRTVSIACAQDSSKQQLQPFDTKTGEHYNYQRFKYTTLQPDGLYSNKYTWRGKKGGILSSPVKVSTQFITNNIDEYIETLFHGLYTQKDFESFQSIWYNIIFNNNFPYKELRKQIVVSFIRRFFLDMSRVQIQKQLPLPEEVIMYAEENNIDIEPIQKQYHYTKWFNLTGDKLEKFKEAHPNKFEKIADRTKTKFSAERYENEK